MSLNIPRLFSIYIVFFNTNCLRRHLKTNIKFPLSNNLCSTMLSCDTALSQQTVHFANTTWDVFPYILSKYPFFMLLPKDEKDFKIKKMVIMNASQFPTQGEEGHSHSDGSIRRDRRNICSNGRRDKMLELSKQNLGYTDRVRYDWKRRNPYQMTWKVLKCLLSKKSSRCFCSPWNTEDEWYDLNYWTQNKSDSS